MSKPMIARWVRPLVAIVAIWAMPGYVGSALAFSLSSTTFKPNGDIPVAQTCDGPRTDGEHQAGEPTAGISPQLSWDEPPPGTQVFGLLVDDPDAPGGSWVHWLLYDIPGSTRSLAQGVAQTASLADGSKHGINSFGNRFYQGPCPPPGDQPHRYVFTLFALDSPTGLAPGTTKRQFLKAVSNHTLGKAELIGRFGH